MANNPTTNSSGQLPTTQLRATDTGAGQAFHGKSAPWIATPVVGAQVLTVSTVAVTLTVPATATHAFISVETGSIRFYNTGDTVTGANGHYLAPGAGPLEIDRLSSFQMIRSGGSDAVVQISYHLYT